MIFYFIPEAGDRYGKVCRAPGFDRGFDDAVPHHRHVFPDADYTRLSFYQR